MAAAEPTLHEELVIEILSWLPVKSLVRFMCMSKPYESFISDPYLVKLHLRRSSNCGISWQHTLFHDFVLPFSPLHLSAAYQNTNISVVGHCNGLVCLLDVHFAEFSSALINKFLLWNPATRKIFEVPPFSFPNNAHRHDYFIDWPWFGFGYDNVSDTYKVVISLFNHDGLLGSSLVQVFNNNSWRRIPSSPVGSGSDVEGCGIYLNNTLNWMTLANERVIVSLDLGNEVFSRFSLPSAVHGSNTSTWLLVLNNCLSVFVRTASMRFSIWQMKEFGNQESWTQLFDVDVHDIPILDGIIIRPKDHLIPICRFRSGCSLMMDYQRDHPCAFIYSETIDNHIRSDIKNSRNILKVNAGNCVRSLVSPA